MRRDWRYWLLIILVSVACVLAIWLTDGETQLGAAFVLGMMVAIAVVGWMIGDVHSLPWLWGWVGERETADVLEELDSTWVCEHDVPRKRGNWDHVLVGPPGVFLLDSKRFSQRVRVAGDELVSGRRRYAGARFRRAAVGLGEVLARRLDERPWVQAVVVIWGDFPQRLSEDAKVVYVHGDALIEWLRRQPKRLSPKRQAAFGAAVRDLKSLSEQPEIAG